MTKPHNAAPATAAGAYFRERNAEFNQAAANRALAAMRKGALLHLQYRNGRQSWSLSNGRSVTADVAILIIANVSVESANDGLFPNLLAQTWRMK